MIDDLKPYPEYQPSGQAWLGEVPVHWEVLPNRALFREIIEKNHPQEEMLSVTITRGVIRQKALLSDTSKKDSSNLNKSAYKLVQPGDIAYNKMRAWQGALGCSPLRGIISPAYVVQRPRERSDPWYFHHLFRTPGFQKEAERWSYGITSDMWSLRPEHFKAIYSPLPPPAEQGAIVRFLAHVNGKIDRFVRTQRRLIALLTEQKQAIIHHAVTRGLDPNVKLKDPGIPWLGEIPEHWEVAPVKRFAQTLNGFAFSSFDYVEAGVPLIRIGDVKADRGVDIASAAKLPSKYLKTHSFVRLKKGDIVMAMTGATIGKASLYTHELPALLNQRVCAFRCRAGTVGQSYLYLLLSSPNYRHQVRLFCYGGAQPNISDKTLAGFPVPVPSLAEQDYICDYVASHCKSLDGAIARAEREIALMQEYRTRLTADVVTGKLDVRAAAQNLPEPEGEGKDINGAPLVERADVDGDFLEAEP